MISVILPFIFNTVISSDTLVSSFLLSFSSTDKCACTHMCDHMHSSFHLSTEATGFYWLQERVIIDLTAWTFMLFPNINPVLVSFR